MIVVVVVLILVVVVVFIVVPWGLDWKSDTFWQVWEWIDQSSSVIFIMEEGAALTILAFSSSSKDFTFLSLVVGVDSTKSSLSEVLWEWLLTKIKM